MNLTPEQELDPQRFSVGGHAGLGWLTNAGSGAGQSSLDFGLILAFGLGQGGFHEPWSAEAFANFALTYSTIVGTQTNPNRLTEFGGRVVYRAPSGPLMHSWLSLGAGIAFSSYGLPNGQHGDLTPGALIDVGVGVHEWLLRRARTGFALRAPLQLSSHPGVALFGVFYALIGTGH